MLFKLLKTRAVKFGADPAVFFARMITESQNLKGNAMNELEMCTSPAMTAVREMVTKVATTSAAVLLTGESGVGKEVVSRAIHRASPRASNQFL